MNVSTRQKIGIGIMVTAVMAGLALQMSGIHLIDIQTKSTGRPYGPISLTFHLHRLLFPVLLVAFVGFVLSILPSRKKTNAHVGPVNSHSH